MTAETTQATAEATSKVSPDMPHVDAHASATGEIPHDREPGEIRKEKNVIKYLKAAFIVILALSIMVLGFLLGKSLFGNRPIVMADEIVANFSAASVGDWFKKTGSMIATGASKAIAWLKGLFTRNVVTAAADAATAAA
jgi:hypothetical protein